jgi:uncharacterized damage-inducible protein DinB
MPTLAETFLAFSVYRLDRSARDIAKCLDRLTDEQMLQRSGDYENSTANLLLHLAGNMRQWVMHGVAGEPDVRTRDAEFSLHLTEPVAEIRKRFEATLAEVRAALAALPEERLMEIIDPQPGSGWEAMTALEGIYQVVGHVQYHVGQIVLLTKQLTVADVDLTLPRKR